MPRVRRQAGDDESLRAAESRPGSSGSPPASWASTEGPNPLGLEGAPPFVGSDEPIPVARARDLEQGEDTFEPPAPEPVEWTPERAAAILRGGFFLARFVDPVAREDEGKQLELWRLDKADALEAGGPLSRMMNRYTPVRTLAGLADEAELGLTLGPLLVEHVRRRGEALAAIENRVVQTAGLGPFDGADPQAARVAPAGGEPVRGPFGPPPPPAEPAA